jgi:iron-sulfur cluster repair protein YtfE (RIC family)
MLTVENKTELLMLLIGLEAVSDLLDNDERMKDWQRDSYTMLINRVAREYHELADEEEAGLVTALVEGWVEL